jgi:PAT family beta-lactamase induction signal transducer AmpG
VKIDAEAPRIMKQLDINEKHMRTRDLGIPIWLMGMCNLSYGFYNGIISFALPQMLAARHVPLQQIAIVSAVTGGGMISLFFLGPILDVWFSRRFYATVLAAASAFCLTVSMLFQRHVLVLEAIMILGFACSTLSQNALGGWLATIVPKKDESNLSAWTQAASVGAGGISTIVAGEMLRGFPIWIGALSLGVLIQLPTLIFLWMPSPQVDRRLARESFGRFFQEVLAVLRRREVLIALALFLAPTSSFAITNLLPAMGDDFHASPRLVSLFGGAALSLAGVAGSLLFVPFGRRFPLRPVYLGIGVAGAIFTTSLLLLPRTPLAFCIATIGENIFQALSLTGSMAITYETIGRNNPFAATQYSLLFCVVEVPIMYMALGDGRAYGWHGVSGALSADACISIAACAIMGWLLFLLRKPKETAEAMTVDAV